MVRPALEGSMMGSTHGIVSLIASVSVAWMFGCGQGTTTTEDSDTGTPTGDTDTAVTTDTDTSTVTPPPTLYEVCQAGLVPPVWTGGAFTSTYAQRCDLGEAIADEVGYDGTDSVWILPMIGPYDIAGAVCVLSYRLTPVAPRDDCGWGPEKPCDWAYDLVISESSVQDPLGMCLDTVGYDATTVTSMNGTVFARGYHSDYSGHATVRMEIIDDEWRSAGYVVYDPDTNVLVYGEVVGNAFPL